MHLDEAVHRVLPPLLEDLVHLGVGDRSAEVARLLDHRADERTLSGVEFTDVLAEVPLGGCLHPDAAPEVNGVEVLLEDLVLRQALLDLERDEDLVELTDVPVDRGRLVGGQRVVVVPGHLLGDGRTTTLRTAEDETAEQTHQVDRVVLVEGAVLGREDTVDHGLRHLLDTDRHPVDFPEPGGLGLAVLEVDDVRCELDVGFGLKVFMGGGHGVGDADPRDPEDEQHRHGDERGLPRFGEEAPDGPSSRRTRPRPPRTGGAVRRHSPSGPRLPDDVRCILHPRHVGDALDARPRDGRNFGSSGDPVPRHCRARPSHQRPAAADGTRPRLAAPECGAGLVEVVVPWVTGTTWTITEVLSAPRAARPIFIVAQRPAGTAPGLVSPETVVLPRPTATRRGALVRGVAVAATPTAVAARFTHRAIGPAATASTPSSFGTHASSFVY